MREVLIDPRDFIGPPFGTCPACGGAEFGSLMISRRSHTKRCRTCWHTEDYDLPEIRKKVVYLDQMAYSNMAKTLDPVWAADRRPQDPFWSRMFDALERAFKLQLIVCPESTVHGKESALAQQPSMIRALYEHLAGGTSFEYPVIIHQHQLTVALRSALRREPVTYDVHRGKILHGDPDEWLERLRIRINMAGLDPQPQQQRAVKARSHAALLQYFDRWKSESGRRFEDWYRSERFGHAYNYISLFNDHVELLRKVEAGTVPFGEDVWNPRIETGIIPTLMHVAGETGIPSEDRLATVLEFLRSDVACDAPLNDLSALLMASLARKAASGQKRPPSPGTWNDFTAISAFLPYCDSMFVDNECAGLLREEPLRRKIAPFGTRIFSRRSGDDFLEYLASLERDAGPDHLRLVEEVYGSDWAKPYREILVYERERKAREQA